MPKKRSKNKHAPAIKMPFNLYLFIGLMIVLLPLLHSSQTIDPVIGIRMLAWNIFLLILLVPIGFGLFEKKLDFSFLRLNLFTLFAFYFLMVVLSVFSALNYSESFFDISKTFLSLTILIFASALFVRYNNFKQLISRGFIISTLIAGLNGVFQYFNISPVETETELFASLYEIGGIMGHKNQFAISLFLLLPFCMYGIFAFKKTWFWLSIVSTLIIFVNIVLLQTRSVWVATLIFIFVLAFIAALFSKHWGKGAEMRWYKNPVIVASAAFVGIAVIVFLMQPAETQKLIAYKISSLTSISSHDNEGRLGVWDASIEIIAEHTFAGVGAGNWKIHIPAHIADLHGQYFKNWNQPHNDFIWIWSEKGILALLLYLGIFGVVIYYGIVYLKRAHDQLSIVFVALLLAGLSGYLSLAMVSFPYERVNHQVVLMIMLAAIATMYFTLQDKPKPELKKLPIVVLGLTSLLLLASLFYNVTAWNTKKNIRMIYAAIDQDKPRAVFDYATKAMNMWISLDEHTTPIYKHRGTANLMLGRQQEALQDLMKAREKHPYHVSTLVNLATAYARNKNYEQAIRYFKAAEKLFPKNQQTIKSLARAYFDSGQIELAYTTILKYDTHKPDPQIAEFIKELETSINAMEQ